MQETSLESASIGIHVLGRREGERGEGREREGGGDYTFANTPPKVSCISTSFDMNGAHSNGCLPVRSRSYAKYGALSHASHSYGSATLSIGTGSQSWHFVSIVVAVEIDV